MVKEWRNGEVNSSPGCCLRRPSEDPERRSVKMLRCALVTGLLVLAAPALSFRGPVTSPRALRRPISRLSAVEDELSVQEKEGTQLFDIIKEVPVLRATDAGAVPRDLGSLWSADDVAVLIFFRSFGMRVALGAPAQSATDASRCLRLNVLPGVGAHVGPGREAKAG
eukprot:scaffold1282_cov251-Pinguiococcus_pyrenoidosus.AAC.28